MHGHTIQKLLLTYNTSHALVNCPSHGDPVSSLHMLSSVLSCEKLLVAKQTLQLLLTQTDHTLDFGPELFGFSSSTRTWEMAIFIQDKQSGHTANIRTIGNIAQITHLMNSYCNIIFIKQSDQIGSYSFGKVYNMQDAGYKAKRVL